MDINVTIIGQMLTFIIFTLFTVKFIWPPLKKSLDDRKDRISQGLKATLYAEEQLKAAYTKANIIVKNAKIESKEILDQANLHVLQTRQKAKELARCDADRILKNAQQECAKQFAAAQQQLHKETAELVIMATEKLISKNIDLKTNHRIIKNILNQI